ncbi:MAG: hypothetical protein K8J08_22950 [Thermoanaerobaculia bacterium]|nr:hypothetical protein [Thermoanaerobaculia bacterium]
MSARAPWVLLGLLLSALLVGAVTFDRTTWPHLVGDEATYLMQAQSLAFDGDLRYEKHDHERFVAQWGFAPEGLILQSGDGGETITFGKPASYSLAIAPFVRWAPRRGAAIGNAFYLALAALGAAASLRRRLGPMAPVWVAVFVFASVTFGHVFWVHADLFLMCLVALALALVYGESDEPTDHEHGLWILAGAGALLAIVGMARPLYLSLLIPAALAGGRGNRRRRWWGLAGGFLAVFILSVVGNFALGHSWTPYGGERMGFYSYTGFPAVDFPTSAWSEALSERPGSGSWVEKGKFVFPINPRLLSYDVVYFLIGRDIGILPYFLPLLLGLLAFTPEQGRWTLLLAVALTAAGFFYLRAFNFYGGGGSLANRYFLPMYPAFWFLAGRPRRWIWPLVITLGAAPFLLPLWTAPRAFPITPEGSLRYVSATARAVLPYETSLSHLKPAGREDVSHNGLWIKFLRPGVEVQPDSPWLDATSGTPVELLVGANDRLEALVLELELPPLVPPQIGGAATSLQPLDDSSKRYRIDLGRPTARHRMWWTFDTVYLYRLEFEGLAPRNGSKEAGFALRPAQTVVETTGRD